MDQNLINRNLLANANLLAYKLGQAKSMEEEMPVDSNGEPLPWYTYPSIEYLSHINFQDQNVFEYGSGNSTLWWARRSKIINSIEHDINYCSSTTSQCINSSISNAELLCVQDKDAYVKSVTNFDPNIIVIDGIHRFACSKYIADRWHFFITKPDLVIFDNSDWYPNSCRELESINDLIRVDFHGFGPINDYTWTTTIFFSRSSHLPSLCPSLRSPIGGLPNHLNNLDDDESSLIKSLDHSSTNSPSYTVDWFTQNIPILDQLKRILHSVNLIVEVGSYEGRSTEWFINNLLDKYGKIYCIDTWEGGEEHNVSEVSRVYDIFSSNILDSNYSNQVVAIKNESYLGLSRLLVNENLGTAIDLVFIDGSHKAEDVLGDAILSDKLLKSGGFLLFDDYMWKGQPGLTTSTPKPAIDSFIEIFNNSYDLIYKGYQVLLRKK